MVCFPNHPRYDGGGHTAIDGGACAEAMMTLVTVEIRAEIVEAARLAGWHPRPEEAPAGQTLDCRHRLIYRSISGR